MTKFFALFFLASLLLVFAGCGNKQETTTKADRDSAYKKLSEQDRRLPKNALAGLEVAEGLQVELFASEPMIGNPTNIDVDAKGRVWMCEAFNYRPKLNPDNPNREEGDRIVILEDTDGDGKADTSKLFYQGTDVNAALGIAVLGNKVIVSCSPNVFIFTDTNGDDKPDQKEVLFTHVGGEQHDHAVHSFTFGPDAKLYFTFGNEGEQLMDKGGEQIKDKEGNEITSKGKPYRQGMVFRLNPDGTGLEVVGHNFRNNYEAVIDSYGTVWQSDNDDDGNQGTRINYVMQHGNFGYTDEITGAGWRARRTNMETEIPKRHWHQNDPGSIPNLLFTGGGSPAGMAFYEGSLIPAAFQNSMIHCDAGTNVVRAYPVQNDGAGYKASIKPILEGVRDQWFRPIDVSVAPDGSLFVADWYDPGVGGHQMGDLSRGRIYRIAPDKSYKISPANLSTPGGAVEALQNPNVATRYLAFQELQEFGVQAEESLKKLWTSDNPAFRARALWLLAKLPGKGAGYLNEGIKDKNSDIRITALRAARDLAPDPTPYLKTLVRDGSPQVRREVALALHHSKSPEAPALWTELALQYDGNDRWYLEALGIGADKQWDPFLAAWKSKLEGSITGKAANDIIWRARTASSLPMLASLITTNTTSSEDRQKYFRAFDFVDDPSKAGVLARLLEDTGAHSKEVVLTALKHMSPGDMKSAKQKKILAQTLVDLRGKQEFIDLVGRYKLTSENKELLHLALRYPDSSIGSGAANLLVRSGGASMLRAAINSNNADTAAAALKVLGRAGTKESMAMMFDIMRNGKISFATRQTAVSMLGGGWSESEQLLTMIKEGKLPDDLKPTAAKALSGSVRKDVRSEALKYLGNAGASGGKSLPPIIELSKKTGNAENGKAVFLSNCSVCHVVKNEGKNFGPALSQIGSKLPKDALYTSILHPDAGISFGYEGYVFTLKDGSQVAGIISSETETELDITLPGGIKKKYERSGVSSRKKMETSMMPSNLQSAITEQQLVDLVEYLYAQKK